jgi:hypothetical protein
MAHASDATLTISDCDNRKPVSDSIIEYSLHDLEIAEYRSREIVGHDDIVARVAWMRARPPHEQMIFREQLSDTERDIIEDYCQIKGKTIFVP